jgi:hypothetical protein
MQPQVQMQGPDDEGGMAKADLYRAAKHSMKLFQMIQDGQQLEGWVQAKITKAADYLDSIYHYMEYQVKFGGGATVSSVQDITGDMETAASVADDEAEEMEESMNYEQRLQALLESAVKKAKKDYDGDGKIETNKDEVWGSRAKAAAKSGKPFKEGFPTVDDAKKNAQGTASMKAGEKKKSSTGGTIEKTKTGIKHTAGKNYSGKSAEADKKVKEGVMDTVKKVAKKVGKAITGPDDEELLQRLEKETGGKRPAKKEAPVKEASKKFDPLKHVKNPTPGEKTAAKDVKRGSYADRAAMLRSAEKDGRLKEADYSAKKAAAGKDIGKPGKNFSKIEKSAGGGEKGKRIAGAVLAKLRAKG